MRFALLMTTVLWAAAQAVSQTLPIKWEEMTAGDFPQALQKAQNTCVLPFGIIEKHGPHLPLGTDLINVRYAALHGAQQEYAVVFPEYYFGRFRCENQFERAGRRVEAVRKWS